MTVVASIQPGGGLQAGTFAEKDTASPLPYVHNQYGADVSGWRPPWVYSPHGYQYTGHRNSIVVAENPWGRLDYMWQVNGLDGTTTATNSGGLHNGSYVAQDGYDHRFTIWQFRHRTVPTSTSGNYGRSYWGITDTGGNVLNANSGAESTNPYWASSTSLAHTGEGAWVLFVGHVYKAGAVTPGPHPDSGFYQSDGTPISGSIIDYVAQSGTRWRYRVFQYRARYTDCWTLYYRPRIDTLDGNQPSIADLCAGNETGDVLADPKHIYPDGTWSHGTFDETGASASMSANTMTSTGMTEV